MNNSTGDTELDKHISLWLKWDKNEKTISALKELIETHKVTELRKIMCKRISFGTAGLRGKMYVGFANMNDLVIIQTAQGFLQYLIKHEAQLLQTNGIVVGYDGRHNSKRWAEITAAVFIHAGYPVYLFEDVVPTPFVPFAVKEYKCASGVVVTASHNPKDDNGYKVYGSNGTQISSPVDVDIQQSILDNLQPLKSSWDTSVLQLSMLLKKPLDDIRSKYISYIDSVILHEDKELNAKMDLLIVYTPMHGVAYNYIQDIANLINGRIQVVPEQRDPDPDFTTVKFPNPEEGKSSLELAFRTADMHGSSLIMANDPDADRFALAEKNKKNNTWKIFTGNELGALFAWWMLRNFKKMDQNVPLDKVYMLSSTVSSMICRSMSKIEGFKFADTLTGFKWLGRKSLVLENEGNKVIFCFEEAIGFMCSTKVLDKDGVSAFAHMVCMVNNIYSQGKTMQQQLEELYAKYGIHISRNSYYICHEPLVIKRIFERIRNWNGPNSYATSILDGKYKIKNVRDLTTGYDDSQPDKKAVLPVSSSSQMITLSFENGFNCTLRTSGTEPKVKYYTELCATPGESDVKKLEGLVLEMTNAICEEMLQPSVNDLKPQSND